MVGFAIAFRFWWLIGKVEVIFCRNRVREVGIPEKIGDTEGGAEIKDCENGA